MMTHPDMLLALARDRHQELLAGAERGRLLAGALRARRGRKTRAARERAGGTLTQCEPSAVVPAQG